MNAILGFSEVIRDRVFGQEKSSWDKYSDYANFIHTSGKHLLSLISEILDLSKIEGGSYVLDVTKLDLRQVIEGALTILSPVAKKAGVDLRALAPGDPIWFTADERAVRQITLNILANAVKFTPNGGHVAVALAVREGAIECAISETGIGIAQEHIETVFEPFCSGSGIRDGRGTARSCDHQKACRDAWRTIAIESEIAAGTTVHVRLPMSASSVPSDKKPSEAA